VKLVCVTWLDANSKHDEHRADEWPEIATVKTYGVLVQKTREAVTVATEILDDKGGNLTYRCTSVIPKGMIVSIEEYDAQDKQE